MKFLIYGRGWISQLITEFLDGNINQKFNNVKTKNEENNIQRDKYEKREYVFGNARLNDIPALLAELKEVQPTNVLCLVGRTHGIIDGKVYPTIDYLEQEGKLVENLRDNLFSQTALALLCIQEGIHLSLINTGCIFTYDETHTLEQGINEEKGFDESSLPNFFGSSYSTVKGFTDQIMHLLPICNARIRMPIFSESHRRNFITKILGYEKICSCSNSMTVLNDLIPVFIDLAERRFIGTVNLTNPGTISHDEILEMYKEIIDPNFTWKNFTYEEQMEVLDAGRSNNFLETKVLESMYNVPHIKESVRNILIKMKEKMV